MLYKREINTTFKGYPSITADVNAIVAESGVKNGFCIVSVPHATAGLCITSFWDKRGLDDLVHEIDRNIPARVNYKSQISPYDASGHVKSAMMGTSKTLIIKDGKLILGSSQGLVFMEFDGPRPREFYVEIIPTASMYLAKRGVNTVYMGMHDITAEVREEIAKSGVKNGICHVSMLHSTAGLVVCAKDEASKKDVMADIERMVPTRADFSHRETASDAGGHVKTALTESQISFIVEDRKLLIGEEQAIVFAEYDGPRPRSYYVGVTEG